MNVSLLNRIADVLEKYPDRHKQDCWIDGVPPESYSVVMTIDRVGECGTRACIAGWAWLLSTKEERAGLPSPLWGMHDAGKKLLGLNFLEADMLFHPRWEPPEGRSVPAFLRKLAVTENYAEAMGVTGL